MHIARKEKGQRDNGWKRRMWPDERCLEAVLAALAMCQIAQTSALVNTQLGISRTTTPIYMAGSIGAEKKNMVHFK